MKKFLIKVNGTKYEVEVEEVQAAGSAVQAPVSAPAASAPVQKAAASSAPAGSSSVTSPMPGTILKVNVNEGDTVKKGQVLLILEAMKMENEITAPADGKISSLTVSKGSIVKAGDVLVAFA